MMRNSVRLAGVAALAAATLGLAPSSALASSGSTPAAAPAESPAIVGPLLQIFTFGADVGIPTGCQAGTAALGSGFAYFGVAQQLGKYIGTVNNACSLAQVQADKYIAKGNTLDAPLAAWNPYVNPVLAETAKSLQQTGTTYGPAIAPFGPTIAGLGATVNFFQGH